MGGQSHLEWRVSLGRGMRAEHGRLAMGSAPTITVDPVTLRKTHIICTKCTQIMHGGANRFIRRSLPRYRKEN